MTDRSNEVAMLQTRLKIAFGKEFPIPSKTERHLAEALSETLQRTGNFMRAQIAYSVARAHGELDEPSLQLAIALEYFHTASLLFDDLPSMDDATHRRGAMCVHHLYGEGSAILSALALINRAYALLWQAAAKSVPEDQAAALGYVELHLGLGGLLNGQSHDLHYSELPLADRSPQKIAMGKTVSLIRLSLVLPAMLGGGSRRVIRLLDRLAIFWGLSYQAIDDLKDVLHDIARTGKTTARDTLLDRPNLALTLGTSTTIERLHKLVRFSARCISRLQTLDASLSCLDVAHQRLASEVAGLAEELVGAER